MSFQSWNSYADFERSVTTAWRYMRDTFQQEYLDALVASSKERVETLKEGTIVFRAQVGCDEREETYDGEIVDILPCAYDPERMKPFRDRASEGRANPKGIPYLYTATEQETAIAEVRPWVGAYVSVAQFKLLRTVKIVNCTETMPLFNLSKLEPEKSTYDQYNWASVDLAFSRPVTAHEHFAAYVPTQIIAERFRQEGFDGVGYHSALGPGHNIALFDIDAADLVNCQLVLVKKVTFDVSMADNPYFVSKYYPNITKPV